MIVDWILARAERANPRLLDLGVALVLTFFSLFGLVTTPLDQGGREVTPLDQGGREVTPLAVASCATSTGRAARHS